MAETDDLRIEYVRVADLVPYARNSRKHPPEQIARLRASIREFGFTNPVLTDGHGGILAGHARVEAARLEGMEAVPTVSLGHLPEAKRRAYVIADNRLAELAQWDLEMLRVEAGDVVSAGLDLEVVGFSDDELRELLGDDPTAGGEGGEGDAPRVSLADRFGIPPFSVLNAREGWWQNRKRAWLALGIRSELGRGANLLKMSDTMLEPDPAKRAAAQREAINSAASFRDQDRLDALRAGGGKRGRRKGEPAGEGTDRAALGPTPGGGGGRASAASGCARARMGP